MSRYIFTFLLCSFTYSACAEVVINEIHLDPDVKTERVEFIELYNNGLLTEDLSGYAFDQGVDFLFPPGTFLAPGAYLVVAENPAAVFSKFGVSSVGPWTGRLANEGDDLRLVDTASNTVDKVDYGLGFPWPVVGDPPGYSFELLNPSFDNDLGGNWRSSATIPATNVTLIAQNSTVKYFKGTAEASSPKDAWRALAYNDSGWSSGGLDIGFGESFIVTDLTDMRYNYSSVFMRKTFVVDDPSVVGNLRFEAKVDDGLNAWVNGTHVQQYNMPTSNPNYNTSASSAIEDKNFLNFDFANPSSYLVPGTNVLCVQLHNASLNNLDCFFNFRLISQIDAQSGPTPGAANSVLVTNAPPRLRQVEHSPNQPSSGDPVLISVKATDLEDGVDTVTLEYQLVNPGSYISIDDAAYDSTWTAVPMLDNGSGGDVLADDEVYSVTLPGVLQTHRRLVRYRIKADDNAGNTVQVPYADDPTPNFAYFVYDGIPAWSGAIQPGAGGANGNVVNFSTNVTRSVQAYHLISKTSDVEDATWFDRYTGDLYLWPGTLVVDGKVYDHIHYRARGGVHRYSMVKHMWKIDFNRAHAFQGRDNFGKKYPTTWDKLNLGACIQQRDFWHRGEQGLFESVGYELFRLVGLESSFNHFTQLRIIDDASESGGDQYDGDFWGLYLSVEQLDGDYLDAHGLPDGNLYKMEAGTGELNNQGPTAVTDRSDLDNFLSTYEGGSQTEQWWRDNLHLEKYYNYRSIVEAIHHYDIHDGKNYFYFLNPEDNKWQVLPWDLDLTWADNMYGTGQEPFVTRTLAIANLYREYQSAFRSIRDLLYNNDEGNRLIDDLASFIDDPGGAPSFVDMDRMRWDYDPRMDSSTYSANLAKAQTGQFYQGDDSGTYDPPTPDFPGMIQQMKDYITSRSAWIDANILADANIPNTPTATYSGPTNYPADALQFTSSAFSDSSGSFAAMAWRIGEVTDTNAPAYTPGDRSVYEVTPVWESGERTPFAATVEVPAGSVKSGHSYRLRVRHKDSTARWSHWSAPLEFTVGIAANVETLQAALKISEVMYNAPQGPDFDYVELWNADPGLGLDLSGVSLSQGISYTFTNGTVLGPTSYVVVAKSPGASFDALYDTGSRMVVGPFSGNLANEGETLHVEPPGGGTNFITLTVSDARGWPLAADGAGHSLVPLVYDSQNDGRLDHPIAWRASAYIKGSPGAADPVPFDGLRINEVAAHTDFSDPGFPDYDSNDWIELFNASGLYRNYTYLYLSDDVNQLDKWPLPAGGLASGNWDDFDEVTGFHSPITNGFGLNKNGEAVLLSYLPTSGVQWVEDAWLFEGQENGASWGRYGDGASALQPLVPTRGTANQTAGTPWVLIREFLFYPPGVSNALEYIELYNPNASNVPLESLEGPWRIRGGTHFDFPAGVSLDAGETLLLVGFDPSDTAASNAFESTYGLTPGSVPLYGPLSDGLSKEGELISLQRPLEPDLPDTTVPWVVVDEVFYATQGAWPGAAEGEALHRLPLDAAALDAGDWRSFAPSPAKNFGPFSMMIEENTPSLMELLWPSELGAGYQVERSFLETMPPLWNPVEFHPGTGALQSTLTPANKTRAWYRIRRVE